MFVVYLGRELRRRSRTAIVIVLGLALGIGLVITVTAAASGVADAQKTVLHSLYGVGTDVTVTKPAERAEGGSEGGPGRFDFGNRTSGSSTTASQDRVRATPTLGQLEDTTVATVASQAGVAAAVGGLSLVDTKVDGTFDPVHSDQGETPDQGDRPGQGGNSGQRQSGVRPQIQVDSFTIAGVDPTRTDVGPLSSANVTSGRGLAESDANTAVALINSEYATQKGLALDSKITISGHEFPVVGIVTVPAGDATSDVYLPLAQAQSVANLAGKVTTIYVKAASASDIATVKGDIESALPGLTVTTSADLAEQVSGSLSSAASLANNLGRWLSIAVLLASFVIAALFTISAVSRRVREFGTLKALGWRSRRIVGQVMGESLVHGALGGVVGIGLGYLGAYLVTRFSPTLTATLGTARSGVAGGQSGRPGGFGGGSGGGGGFGALRNAVQNVDVHLNATVTTTSLALAVGLAVAGGLLAGLFGGWRAARMRPADALRRVA